MCCKTISCPNKPENSGARQLVLLNPANYFAKGLILDEQATTKFAKTNA